MSFGIFSVAGAEMNENFILKSFQAISMQTTSPFLGIRILSVFSEAYHYFGPIGHSERMMH